MPGQKKFSQQQEAFALDIFKGMTNSEAYLRNYRTKGNPNTVRRAAFALAHSPKIVARLAELNLKRENVTITTANERRIILTQIQRATMADFMDDNGNLILNDKERFRSPAVQSIRIRETPTGTRTTLTLRDPVPSIDVHNKMDKIYSDAPPGNQDNRQINIYVVDNEAKDLIAQVKERTQKLIEG